MGRKPYNVTGLSELIKDLEAVDRDLPKVLKAKLQEAAEPVAHDAADKLRALQPASTRSADGIIVRVRNAGLVTVEQKERKTTGRRPDWGATQMTHALLPAAEEKGAEAVRSVEDAIDEVAHTHGL